MVRRVKHPGTRLMAAMERPVRTMSVDKSTLKEILVHNLLGKAIYNRTLEQCKIHTPSKILFKIKLSTKIPETWVPILGHDCTK